jgi:cytochrome c peroxidase
MKPFPPSPPALSPARLLALAGAFVLTAAHGQALEPLKPLPPAPQFDARKVDLGRRLFQDPRLARDNSVACISCHSFQHGGADPRPRSVGAGGALGAVNSPSIFNVAHNFRQLWNGGTRSLEDQIDNVLANPKVFDSSWPQALGKLRADTALVSAFAEAYPQGLDRASARDALATYERSLLTPSRFDRYLRGDGLAISMEEKKGYDLFKRYGCVACHQGVNVGGNMLQKFGALGDYFQAREAAGRKIGEADRGLYNVTKRPEDLHVFKVPSLRNVALTAPYFHDASAATLEEAVDVMFRVQLGRPAPGADKALIVKFLRTLSGEAPPAP